MLNCYEWIIDKLFAGFRYHTNHLKQIHNLTFSSIRIINSFNVMWMSVEIKLDSIISIIIVNLKKYRMLNGLISPSCTATDVFVSVFFQFAFVIGD